MIEGLMNAVAARADLMGQTRAATRHGIISSYDPDTCAVKVTLQPDGTLTGWMPLKSAAVGNGWGIVFAPSIGDAVELSFQEDDGGVGSVGWRFYNDSERPPPAPGGEWWLVHKSGSLLKFHTDGSVELTAAGTLTTSAQQWNHTGPVAIDGDVTVTGKVSGSTDLVTGSVSLKSHVHKGVAAGAALSGPPNT